MPDVEDLVQKGIAAVKAGRKAEARRLLEQAVETLAEQQICLANVLEINPNNEKAKKGFAAINNARNNKHQKSDTSHFSNWSEFSDWFASVLKDETPMASPHPLPHVSKGKKIFISYRRDDSADVCG